MLYNMPLRRVSGSHGNRIDISIEQVSLLSFVASPQRKDRSFRSFTRVDLCPEQAIVLAVC